MCGKFRRARDLSNFRKIAVNTWKRGSSPIIYGTIDIDMTEALDLIAEYRKQGKKLTPTHLVARAVAMVYAENPGINAKVELGRLYYRDTVDMFLLVDVDSGEDTSGVMIRQADRLTLDEMMDTISLRVKKIRERTDQRYRSGQAGMGAKPDLLVKFMLASGSFMANTLNVDLSRWGLPNDPFGSVVITSVGMMDVEEAFLPSSPLSRASMEILVSTIKKKAVVLEDDRIVSRPVMRLCASIDHRIMDGHQAAGVSNAVKRYIENPALILKRDRDIIKTGTKECGRDKGGDRGTRG